MGVTRPTRPPEKRQDTRAAAAGHGDAVPVCPFDVSIDTIARLLNTELADHDVYDGLEVQWFDDDEHGTGMLAFLSRRADRRVDYYVAPGLRLDRSNYEIGGGTGAWTETDFEVARLEVDRDGVSADVRFRDRDGRCIDMRVDDRAAGRRRTGALLAPVGAGIEAPVSLMLVYLRNFELVRRTATAPIIRIDGEPVATGTLPGGALHRRHLIKAAAPVTVVTICRSGSRELVPTAPATAGSLVLDREGQGIAAIGATDGRESAEMVFEPPFPPLSGLVDGMPTRGAWSVRIAENVITGGTWHARRNDDRVALSLEVTRGWRPPAGLPPLLRIVTGIVPTFRRWPTSYRWRAEVQLDGSPRMRSRWERIGRARGDAYRRATGS